VEQEAAVREACKKWGEDLTSLDGAFFLHMEVARTMWGPLLIGFIDWIWATIRHDEVPLFLLRDAGPMLYLTQQPLWQHDRSTRGVWLSRKLLGVQDIWTGQYTGKPDLGKLKRYLGQSGLDRPNVVLVDTGKYGSLLKRLEQSPFDWTPQSRFLVSGNPHVPGWLNHLDVPVELRNLVLDSIELFFVKRYRSVEDLDPSTLRQRMPRPLQVRSGRISQELYAANGLGLELAERRRPIRHRKEILDCESDQGFRGIERVLGEIETAAIKAADRWTGVIPAALPVSQDPTTFMLGWPTRLVGINPQHLLPGGYRSNRRTVS